MAYVSNAVPGSDYGVTINHTNAEYRKARDNAKKEGTKIGAYYAKRFHRLITLSALVEPNFSMLKSEYDIFLQYLNA